MNARKMLAGAGVAVAVGMGGFAVGTPTQARAQDAEYMGCGELWRARNAIYARNGHCFNTARGRAEFGEGCFPPYGRLSGGEQRRVNQIQMWERRKGC